MKKIMLSIVFAASVYGLAAQNVPTDTSMGGKPINPVTDQFQNGNEMGWEANQLTETPFSDIPAPVASAFKQKYPDQSNTTWYKHEKGYTVAFVDKDQMQNRVMHDNTGTMTGSAIQVKSGALNPNTSAYLKKNYPKVTTYDRAFVVTSPTGEKYYMVLVNGQWVQFDKSGNYLPPR